MLLFLLAGMEAWKRRIHVIVYLWANYFDWIFFVISSISLTCSWSFNRNLSLEMGFYFELSIFTTLYVVCHVKSKEFDVIIKWDRRRSILKIIFVNQKLHEHKYEWRINDRTHKDLSVRAFYVIRYILSPEWEWKYEEWLWKIDFIYSITCTNGILSFSSLFFILPSYLITYFKYIK